MTAERDLHDIFEARLRDVPPLRPTVLGDVFAHTRTMPQRRNRWPLHIFEEDWTGLADVSAADAVHTPIPATIGPVPVRRSTMFSALKSVVAGVVVALFGGLLLAGVLTTQQGDEPVPAADTASPVSHEAAVFSGTMPWPNNCLAPNPVLEEGMLTRRGTVCEGVSFEDVTDPRLGGTWRTIINEDTYMGETASGVWAAASRIDNAEGSWLGHFTGYQYWDEGHYYHEGVLTGAGGYDGLTAVMFLIDTGDFNYDVHGMIFPGELPEFPEYPGPAE